MGSLAKVLLCARPLSELSHNVWLLHTSLCSFVVALHKIRRVIHCFQNRFVTLFCILKQFFFLFTLTGRESTLSAACVCRNLESNLIRYSCLVSKEAHQELNPLNIMLKWPICFVIYVSLRLHMCLWEGHVRLHFKRALFARMQIVLQGRRSYYSAIEAAVWRGKKKTQNKPRCETLWKNHAFITLYFLVKIWHLHYPQRCLAANGALGDLAALY